MHSQIVRHQVVPHDMAEADPTSATHPMGGPSQTPTSSTLAELAPLIKHGKQTTTVKESVHRVVQDFTLCHDAADCLLHLQCAFSHTAVVCIHCLSRLSDTYHTSLYAWFDAESHTLDVASLSLLWYV